MTAVLRKAYFGFYNSCSGCKSLSCRILYKDYRHSVDYVNYVDYPQTNGGSMKRTPHFIKQYFFLFFFKRKPRFLFCRNFLRFAKETSSPRLASLTNTKAINRWDWNRKIRESVRQQVAWQEPFSIMNIVETLVWERRPKTSCPSLIV